MPQEIHLAALRDFACLAGDCPDNCCRADWEIPVDAPTWARWQALADSAVRNELLAQTAEKIGNGKTRQLLAKRPDHSCVHLAADGLCGMQARHGAEYLPAICRDYPRIQPYTPVRRLFSATLSCPEVVRLVLFAGNPRPPFDPGGDPAALADPIAAFLETLTDRVLAERQFPLNVRVYFLGKVLTGLALQAEQGGLTEAALRRQAARFKDELYETSLAVKTKRLQPEPFTAGSFWKGVHDFGATRGLYARQGAPDALRGLLESTAHDNTADYRAIHRQLQELRAAAQPLLRDAYTEAFETYMRVSFLNKGFPWKPASGNYLATFINALLPFATIQFALWLRFQEVRTITPNDVQTAIYKVERGLGHSSLIYDYLELHPELLRLDRYLDCLLEIF
ncbi:MAG: flagellin lysine-N-methylase [Gammaproteobacteria bacterium]|nr:flagellin lysine-N-methylase [Gammaproteobacteria bacterium]